MYRVNEVFYSLQGEGMRAGTANIFVRFSGCNLRCAREGEAGFDCDTEFVSGREFSADALRREVVEAMEREAQPIAGKLPGVIFTGGEPGLQLDAPLVEAFKAGGFYLAVETNGTCELPSGLDWVCVSPKSAEHTLKVERADEVKYVRNVGQGIPRPRVRATHKLISPAFRAVEVGIPAGTEGEEKFRGLWKTIYEPEPGALAWCIKLVKQNPEWRLSVQQHKQWGVR